ncbi:hypothetical protein KR084_012226 [Drosophila pseudotakahashii]|nr:hypothetical protein KR084_012226 [Drosophila pseudotakahashii]
MYIKVKFTKQPSFIDGPACFELQDNSTVLKLMQCLEPVVALPLSAIQIRSTNQALESGVHLREVLRKKDVQETARNRNRGLTVVAGDQVIASLRFYEYGHCEKRGVFLPAEALLVPRAEFLL